MPSTQTKVRKYDARSPRGLTCWCPKLRRAYIQCGCIEHRAAGRTPQLTSNKTVSACLHLTIILCTDRGKSPRHQSWPLFFHTKPPSKPQLQLDVCSIAGKDGCKQGQFMARAICFAHKELSTILPGLMLPCDCEGLLRERKMFFHSSPTVIQTYLL